MSAALAARGVVLLHVHLPSGRQLKDQEAPESMTVQQLKEA